MTLVSRGRILKTTAITAPTAAFTQGSQAGVPTGTTLTTTTGIPTADATESLTLTNPVTGVSNTYTVSVWRRRSWTTTITPAPGSGQVWLFDECRFDCANSFWCVEVDSSNTTITLAKPCVVFRRCTFDGNDNTDKAILGSGVWFLGCHVGNAEDAWGGAGVGVAIDSNFISTTNTNTADPHQDGIQCTDVGEMVMYHSWVQATDPVASSAFRLGTEFGATANVALRYCGMSGGGYTLQMRGDSGAGNITGVSVIGCRWGTAVFGPVDAVEVTVDTWSDNAYFNGTVIPAP